ncbi:MAG TPA: TlpA disulfide reductase family protein [Vicinamibacterales bacterium]|jgi:peroxiredoxin
MKFRALLCAAMLLGALLPEQAVAADKFKPFTLKTLDGSERSLSSVLGKATLVVFFYPTCPYCNAAFPSVQTIYDAYKDRGLSMVWINVITNEEGLIAPWQKEHGYTVPVLLGDRALAMSYNLRMTPTHYVLDAKGQVVSSHAGYKSGDEKELERSIQKALGL